MCWGEYVVLLSFSHVSFAFGAYVLRIEKSCWYIFPLMSMKCPSPSLLITFGRKFILFDIRMTTPACFLELFSWKTFVQLVSLSVCLCYWDVFLVCTRMMDPVYISSLLAYVFLLENWVHWCWELLKTDDCYCYFCCLRWYFLFVICFFWVCCEMINFLCFLWCSYHPCVGVAFPIFFVGLD